MADKKLSFVTDTKHLKYQCHVFFCTNTHKSKVCCASKGSNDLWRYAKDEIIKLGLHRKAHIRINKAGCFGFCEHGPVVVVYPDGVWYRYQTKADIDEILKAHVLDGEVVSHLLI